MKIADADEREQPHERRSSAAGRPLAEVAAARARRAERARRDALRGVSAVTGSSSKKSNWMSSSGGSMA